MNTHYIPERNSSGIFADHILSNGWAITGDWQDPCETSTVQHFAIGTRLILGDQSFRYGYFHNAVANLSYALVNGNIIPTDGAEVAIAAGSAIGDHTITVLDTTVRAVDYYQNGYVWFYPTAGDSALNHHMHRRIISSTAGAGTSVTLTLDYPLTCVPAMTCDVYPSPYSKIGTAGHFSSGNEMFVGYAHIYHAAGAYGWVQTWGPAEGHYTGGATEWPGNQGPNDRQVIFSVEGGLRTTKSSGTVVPLASQIAGYVIPATNANYGSCFVYLQIAP